MVAAYIIVALLLLPIVYSYIGYPLLLLFLPDKKYQDSQNSQDCIKIALVIPIYNEEKILAQKLESILCSSIDRDSLSIYLLLDACTDDSHSIAIAYQNKGLPIHIIPFEKRMGKPRLLNYIMHKIDSTVYPITVFSDANVIFFSETLEKLISPFSDPNLGLTDSRLVTAILTNTQESSYLQYESSIKVLESKKLGYMQGPFGGCYAIRTSLFCTIPETFLVDDFYIGTSVLLQGYYAVVAADAKVMEHYSSDWKSEFVRKRRIAAGNFQNLSCFLPKLYKEKNFSILFCFFSHKVLRWISPYLLFTALILIILLFTYKGIIMPLLCIIFLLGTADIILSRVFSYASIALRFLYFVWMNMATALGGWDYINGITSNIWQRTER